MSSIHQMNLHEIIPLRVPGNTKSQGRITRVPGGWIYEMWDCLNEVYTSQTFVPYNEEFKNAKNL